MTDQTIKNPFIFLLFGASGDLAKIKIFPALYQLAEQNRLPKDYYIVGFARTKKNNSSFRSEFKQAVKINLAGKIDKEVLNKLAEKVYYFTGSYEKQEDFKNLRSLFKKLTKNKKVAKVAYFSVPPTTFEDIIQNLGETRRRKNEDLRIVLEKPFGEDEKSATKLFHFASTYFSEDQIYLLDHYLGKPPVQSILSLRHSNKLLNLIMKGPEVANIQISALESGGVGKRVGYFEQVGTLKDMIQSHLLQILALITMSIPISSDEKGLHREKNNILSALKFYKSSENLVLGQYEYYNQKKGVKRNSTTNTYVALRLFIDRESWFKVPIYIRTGKKLAKKSTCVVIELKKFAFQPESETPNRIILELQPEEKISIKLVNKHGRSTEYQDITTTDSIACEGPGCISEHGALILDILKNNKMYFLSFPEVIASWRLTDDIVNFIKEAELSPEKYSQGSYGPRSHKKLTEMDGFKWYKV